MYTLVWNDSNQQYSICSGDPQSIWYAYWYIKKGMEKESSAFTRKITMYLNGRQVDSEKGSSLPVVGKNEDATIYFPPE